VCYDLTISVERMLRTFFLTVAQVGASYDEERATVYAHLASASYCSYPTLKDDSDLLKWNCGPDCDAVTGMTDVFSINSLVQNDAFAYGGKLNGECILVFRGTSDLAGWMEDLKSAALVDLTGQGVGCSYQGTPCKVGDGFMTNYNSISSMIVGNLTNIGCDATAPVSVIGHSLGAAEAAIAMFDLKNQGFTIGQSYTFGSPRVGDAAFANAFEEAFGSAEPWRVTHASDPVVHLPFEFMGFTHVSTEIFYPHDTSDGHIQCDGSGEDKTCANSRSADVPGATLVCADGDWRCDHLTYMAAVKQTWMRGVNCTGFSASLMV